MCIRDRLEYQKNVKSGDMSNMEGIAAQHYWKYLISPDFLRGRFGDSPNQFFNFGYSVLRSIVAVSYTHLDVYKRQAERHSVHCG